MFDDIKSNQDNMFDMLLIVWGSSNTVYSRQLIRAHMFPCTLQFFSFVLLYLVYASFSSANLALTVIFPDALNSWTRGLVSFAMLPCKFWYLAYVFTFNEGVARQKDDTMWRNLYAISVIKIASLCFSLCFWCSKSTEDWIRI